MARTATLTVLRDQIRALSDTQGLTARHTNADLLRAINQSIQHFREKVSAHGSKNYLTHATGTLTVGATSPFAFGVLDLSALSPNVVRVYGIELTVNGIVRPLEQVDFDSRNDFQQAEGGTNRGEPVAFANYQKARVAILPASDAAYPYTVWYLPVLADLVADADTFDGFQGWEEWVAWDVLIKLLQRDQYPQLYQTATMERDAIWQTIEKMCNPVRSGGIIRRVDSRGLRTNRLHWRNRWGRE